MVFRESKHFKVEQISFGFEIKHEDIECICSNSAVTDDHLILFLD